MGGNSGSAVSRIVPSSGPSAEPRPPIMEMKNRIDRSSVNASG
jgi:hypothetical protein